MEYLVDNNKYVLHYQDLKEEWMRFCEMDDTEFQSNIIDAIHLACIICYLKELGIEQTIGDRGIIHELVHLAAGNPAPHYVGRVRELFKTTLRLV